MGTVKWKPSSQAIDNLRGRVVQVAYDIAKGAQLAASTRLSRPFPPASRQTQPPALRSGQLADSVRGEISQPQTGVVRITLSARGGLLMNPKRRTAMKRLLSEELVGACKSRIR